MTKTVELSMENFQKWLDDVVAYFNHLNLDEQLAWAAIALGFFLFIIGILTI